MRRKVTWFLCKIDDFACCLRNNGFEYTFDVLTTSLVRKFSFVLNCRFFNCLLKSCLLMVLLLLTIPLILTMIMNIQLKLTLTILLLLVLSFYFNSLYLVYFILCNINKNSKFIPITGCGGYYKRREGDGKVIAWYFHQDYQKIKESLCQKSFWKWLVHTSLLVFLNRYKLHIPYEITSESTLEIIKRQVDIAKMYGVYGFGFQYSDQEFLSLFLKHEEIEMPFCVRCDLKDFDRDSFEENIFSCFRDQRYIRVNGKPFFCITLCEEFGVENIDQFLHSFRNKALAFGFSGVHIVLSGDFSSKDVADFGADAYMEFWTSNSAKGCDNICNCVPLQSYKSKVWYRSGLISFDNRPKSSVGSNHITCKITPKIYKTRLLDILRENYSIKDSEHNYVFVNNWNEWANGSSLEPDRLYGYSYLDVTQEALEELWDLDTSVIDRALDERRRKGITDIRFCVHAIEYLGDVISCEPISRYLKKLKPEAKVVWLVRKSFVDVVKYNPNIDQIIEVSDLKESSKLIDDLRIDKRNIIVDCDHDKRPYGLQKNHYNKNNPKVNIETYYFYGSLLSGVCCRAGLPEVTDAPIFRQRPGLKLPGTVPCKYVVFHCASNDKNRCWDNVKWNNLAKKMIKQGFNIVEVGLKPVVRIGGNKGYYDCTHIHDIQVISEIVRNSEKFIGLDSGFAHVANCFNIPGVLIFGRFRNFEKVMPYTGPYASGRTIILYPDTRGPARDVTVEQVLDATINIPK